MQRFQLVDGNARILPLLAIAGAVATLATSLGNAFPRGIAWATLGVAACFATLAAINAVIAVDPAWWRDRWPGSLMNHVTAVPLPARRRELIAGTAIPVSRQDFKVVWQTWCDDLTALMRSRGFHREPQMTKPPT